MEHQVRAARVTDVDRLVALSASLAVDSVGARAVAIHRSAQLVCHPPTPNEEARDRGGIRRASPVMTNAAELRDRAGRANTYPKEYQ